MSRTEKKEIQEFLRRRGISPLKQLGQNFLINKSLAERIVRAVKALPPPYVEIGPGAGALTRFFKKEELVLLIERDRKQAACWSDRGFSVICGDALRHDSFPSPSVTVFGNLPYSLAGPLLLKVCSHETVSNMVFMMQKEVALKIQSAPRSGKSYGILSVMSAVFWAVSFEADAAPKDFYPAPKVSGRVLKFRREKSAALSPSEAASFLHFLKRCFANRRKKLIKKIPADPAQAAAFLNRINKSPSARAEELSPDEFVRLYRLLPP